MQAWALIAKDRERGARALVEEYGRRLYATAYRLCLNEKDAEDLVFRTFARVVERIGSFQGRSEFFTWMCAILVNFHHMDMRRFVWFGDEQSLTGYSGKAIDFCFSPHCLAAFRDFLKNRYGSLDVLNAEWETDFSSWEAVMPFTRQEIWDADGRHVAGWADHLEFMDGRLSGSLENACSALREKDPNLRFSISGTQAPTAYGGMDWWRQLRVLDCAMNYNEGGQYEIHRSFLPEGGTMPWAWGWWTIKVRDICGEATTQSIHPRSAKSDGVR